MYYKYKIFGGASIPYVEKRICFLFKDDDQKIINGIIEECAKYSSTTLGENIHKHRGKRHIILITELPYQMKALNDFLKRMGEKMLKMKAWSTRVKDDAGCLCLNKRKAKSVMLSTDCCEYVDFCDIEVRREPQLDKYYVEDNAEMYYIYVKMSFQNQYMENHSLCLLKYNTENIFVEYERLILRGNL